MLVIDDSTVVNYLSDLIDYYKVRDNNFKTIFLSDEDKESSKSVSAWYNHEILTGEHTIFFNLCNFRSLFYCLSTGLIDINEFFGILTLIAGHEYRHFEQGRSMFDKKEVSGFTFQDGLETQTVLYIANFFDMYYLINKGNLKCEEDAELFAIKNGIEFMKNKIPDIDAKKAILGAAKFLANLYKDSSFMSTMPDQSDSIDILIKKIELRIEKNDRQQFLPKAMRVVDPACFGFHEKYNLDYYKLMSNYDFLSEYAYTSDGAKRDMLVAKRILGLVNDPVDSLNEVNILKERYLAKKL